MSMSAREKRKVVIVQEALKWQINDFLLLNILLSPAKLLSEYLSQG